MENPAFIPYESGFAPGCSAEQAAEAFYEVLKSRRSIRDFSAQPVSRATIEWIVRAATTAPNGANKQPWRFVAVQDPKLKRAIRLGAEKEERELYAGRASEAWLKDIEPLGTDANKAFLEVAPWLIVVFRLTAADDGSKVYYSEESVGLATGMLLAAAHHAGLATLTHTPSPMKFLAELLNRPSHERAYMLIPVGYPAAGCTVPAHAITRKPLEEVLIFDCPES